MQLVFWAEVLQFSSFELPALSAYKNCLQRTENTHLYLLFNNYGAKQHTLPLIWLHQYCFKVEQSSIKINIWFTVRMQRLRCLSAAEVEASEAAAEVTDRSAGDGAECWPRRQERNPGQDQSWEGWVSVSHLFWCRSVHLRVKDSSSQEIISCLFVTADQTKMSSWQKKIRDFTFSFWNRSNRWRNWRTAWSSTAEWAASEPEHILRFSEN